MATPEPLTGPINSGNPAEYSILELAEKIIQLTEAKSKICFRALPEDDLIQRQPDIACAKEKLVWEPTVSLDEGLEKTSHYFKTVLLAK